MMKKKFITYMLDFMLDKASPLNLYEKKSSMGNPAFPPNLSTVFEIACYLINLTDVLTAEDSMMLYSPRLIEKMFRSINNIKFVLEFVKKMCLNNMLYSEIICTSLLKQFSCCTLDEMLIYMQISVEILSLKD